MKSLLSGPKFNSRHQTFVPGLEKLLADLKENVSVKKIFLGSISPSRSGTPHAKIRSVKGNYIEIMYRGRLGVQFIGVVSTDIDAVEKIVSQYKRSKKSKGKKEATAPKSQVAKNDKGPNAVTRKKVKPRQQGAYFKGAPKMGELFPELHKLHIRLDKKREVLLKLINNLGELGVSRQDVADLLAKKTYRRITEETLASWVCDPGLPNARKCPSWAISILKSYYADSTR